jgi:intracellular sulfur oxidation DsrE/DsrF family protein
MNANRIVRTAAACIALAAIVLGVAGPRDAYAGDPAGQRNRVIFQVSDADPAKWNLTLNNVRNIQADLGAANVDIEVVSYGPGIGMLQANSPVGSRVEEALLAGVKVVACENTMKAQKLARADMLSGIGYVGAGVVELVQRQQQGWAYIRP